MEESPEKHQNSLAAPFIFAVVMLFHFSSKWLEHMKKKGSKSAMEIQLRGEIKQLLREASTLSQPSTFAQAAKLRRMAAAKEKELVKNQELHSREVTLSYDPYLKLVFIIKVLTYLMLICWFWRNPVAAISKQLVQPFGRVLSWRAKAVLNDDVVVGIIPWLILSTRVSKFICRLLK